VGQAAQRTVEQSTFFAVESSFILWEAQAQSAMSPIVRTSFFTLFMVFLLLSVSHPGGGVTTARKQFLNQLGRLC
jgi:hypothetical protein